MPKSPSLHIMANSKYGATFATAFAIKNPYGKHLFVTNAHVATDTVKLFLRNGFKQKFKKQIYIDGLNVGQVKGVIAKHNISGNIYNIQGSKDAYRYVKKGVDIAILEAKSLPEGFTAPKLTLAESSENCLVDFTGFDKGQPRYYSGGYVESHNQGYITFADKFVIPGTSGAPILNEDGHVISILHTFISNEITDYALHKLKVGDEVKSNYYYSSDNVPKKPIILSALATPTKYIKELLIEKYGYYN